MVEVHPSSSCDNQESKDKTQINSVHLLSQLKFLVTQRLSLPVKSPVKSLSGSGKGTFHLELAIGQAGHGPPIGRSDFASAPSLPGHSLSTAWPAISEEVPNQWLPKDHGVRQTKYFNPGNPDNPGNLQLISKAALQIHTSANPLKLTNVLSLRVFGTRVAHLVSAHLYLDLVCCLGGLGFCPVAGRHNSLAKSKCKMM